MKSILFPLFTLLTFSSFAQSGWMSNRSTQTNIFLDPTEIQMSGSINGVLSENVTKEQYLPFSVGVDQSIFYKQINSKKAWEIVGEMGVFTQFEWLEVEGIQQRNLINIDYKVAFSYLRQIDEMNTYRIRFFHVSSHLGDDYIIRNQIRSYTENRVNYEQLEFTYFKQLPKIHSKLVAGVGSVIRPNALRLPFSYIVGIDRTNRVKKRSLTGGFVVKGFQETNFNLNLKAAVGLAYRSETKNEPVRIVLEYYTGHLPYSQYEQQKIDWLGLGLYFNI